MVVRGLEPCPSTPNCVSTQAPASDPTHRAEPIPVPGSPEGAMAAVLTALQTLPRCEVVERDARYVHAVVSSRWLRFKDDVELLIDDEHIHYRSASRMGRSDLGVNRRRMDALAAEISRRLAG